MKEAYELEVDQIIQVHSNEYIEPEVQMPGAPGIRRLEVECVGKGTQEIKFVHVRPYEFAGLDWQNSEGYDGKG